MTTLEQVLLGQEFAQRRQGGISLDSLVTTLGTTRMRGKCVCMPSHFSHGGLCATHGLQSTRSLCPWDSPGKKLEWVAMPSFRGSSPPKDQTQVSYTSCIDTWVLYHWCHLGSPVMKPQWWWFSCSVVSDSCDPLDCSLLGSSVPGILQARTLEWVAVPSSRKSSQLRD